MSGFEKAVGALTVGNTVWLAILTLYQYRTNTALKTTLVEQEKMLKRQQGQIRELQDLIKGTDLIKEAVKVLDEDLHEIEDTQTETNEELREKLNRHDEQMEIIIEELRRQGYDVESILEGDFSSVQPAQTSKSRSGRPSRPAKKVTKEVVKEPPLVKPRGKRSGKVSRPTTPAKSKSVPEPHTETESEFDAGAFVAAVEKKRGK